MFFYLFVLANSQTQLKFGGVANYKCDDLNPTRNPSLTLWRPAGYGDFWKKEHPNARGFAWEYLCSCTGYGPGRKSKDATSLLVCTRKKIFCLGVRVSEDF